MLVVVLVWQELAAAVGEVQAEVMVVLVVVLAVIFKLSYQAHLQHILMPLGQEVLQEQQLVQILVVPAALV
jgi:hypothetical protein